MAKLRLGSLQLRIETGRYCKPRLDESLRVCLLCSEQSSSQPLPIENEIHFMFYCFSLNSLRTKWLRQLLLPANFTSLDDASKMSIVLNDENNVKETAQYLIDAFDLRGKLNNLL